MKFDYTVETNKTPDQATMSVEKETVRAGFKVFYIHDIQKTLKAKGLEIEPFKIVEICNAKSAYRALKAEIKIGLCLPCKINVYVKGNKTFISGMRPIILPQFFPKSKVGNLPPAVDHVIQNIINNAK